jgi:hypothetical protein
MLFFFYLLRIKINMYAAVLQINFLIILKIEIVFEFQESTESDGTAAAALDYNVLESARKVLL